MKVAIVGGGIAGLMSAYFLRARGAEVVVLESNRLGAAASSNNAGWVCPAQAGPLPEPGLIGYGARSLLSPDSALYFDPRAMPRMASWLARFARRCNARDHARGLEALAVLGRRTFALTEQLVADGVAFELYKRGLLVVGRDVEAFLAPLRGVGLHTPVLSAAEVGEREPLLAANAEPGALIEEHWHLRGADLMHGLAAKLRDMGVTLEEGAEVFELEVRDGRARAVRSAAGTFEADAVVLAAGAWMPGLAKLPVAPGKGYALEFHPPAQPHHSLLLLEAHVGVTPLNDRLRIAGTMEFSGVNARIDQRRVAAIVRGAEAVLGDLGPVANAQSGMRPIAPDGLPIIDRLPKHENVFVATAYSMLGITLAAPAAEALTELIFTGERPAALEPFRATRRF